MQARGFLAVSLLLAVALAGCTGQFDVQQTEPLRIRLEGDGAGTGGGTAQTGTIELRVDETQRERIVVVEKPAETTVMVFDITVRAASGGSTGTTGNGTGNQTGNNTGNGTGTTAVTDVIVNIIIRVRDGEELQQRQVTAPAGSTGTANLNVDVRGKDNIVVITQAVQGSAIVDVDAKGRKG